MVAPPTATLFFDPNAEIAIELPLSEIILAKLGTHLAVLHSSYIFHLETNGDRAEFYFPDAERTNVDLDAETVTIEAIARSTPEQFLADLSAIEGVQVRRIYDRHVALEISLDDLDALASLDSLDLARPIYTPPNAILLSFSSPVPVEEIQLVSDDSELAFWIGTDLNELDDRYQEHLQTGGSMATFDSQDPLLQVSDDGRVALQATAIASPDALQSDLEALGFEVSQRSGRTLFGSLPLDRLSDLGGMETLQFARPAYRPQAEVGAVTSQGDAALQADVARTSFDLDGSGVTIGVISDSYNNLGGATTDILTGDLPATGVNVVSELSGGGTDEGRAMLQLITDVAPGAELAFATGFSTQADFAAAIGNLAQAGADVIVDDLVYLDEPFYQDGIVAQAADAVVADGVAYFSAAGNSGTNAYESSFSQSGQTLAVETIFGVRELEGHDFDPGMGTDIFQEISIPVGATVRFSLQWDDPFASLSSDPAIAADSDLDILLLSSDNTQAVAGSVDFNFDRDPVEVFLFENDGSLGTEFNLFIGRRTDRPNPAPGQFKYITFGNTDIEEFATNSPTLFGHANAEGAQAVGAAFYDQTPEFGTNPPRVESFSALGGTPILFDSQGNRLQTPDTRAKPEIVAPDGTNTTFFGTDIGTDSDSSPNFFGTSAAAPHAAAVAALMLEAVPDATPTEIYDAMQTTAIDMDDPNTPGFDTGFDDRTGFGFLQADRAIESLLANPPANPGEIGLDADGNGVADALTDGLLILRYLSGFSGEALIADAIAPDATRNATEIAAFLAVGEDTLLDADGNGTADSLSDGILITRFLFGFEGEMLIEDAIAPDATRTTPEAIVSFLESFLPANSQSDPVTNAIAPAVVANSSGWLDLTEVEAPTTAIAIRDIASDADFSNVAGWYAVEDEEGTLLDPLTGESLLPGDAGYVRAAIEHSQTFGNGFSFAANAERATAELNSGQLYAPFAIADGTPTELLDADTGNDPEVYFAFAGGNSDDSEHLRSLGESRFGWEDFPGGGDRDFNDISFAIDATGISI